MIIIDDRRFGHNIGNIEVINRLGKRRITHAIHDIDGTHSLIREWVPVMSISLAYAIESGLKGDYDSSENIGKLCAVIGKRSLPETDRFCIESAGMSALAQMEWAIRRGIEEENIKIEGLGMSDEVKKKNSEIIQGLWTGEERFDDEDEPPALKAYLREHTPRLFKFYENLLNMNCRDKNLAAARKNPVKWRTPGSLEFIKTLHEWGVLNYFVTGAVVQMGPSGELEGGIYEEALAVGFEIGKGKMIERIYGSTWDKKMSKGEIIRELCSSFDIHPENFLVVGDGRSEIKVGVDIGAVTMSRLDLKAKRQREIHKELGTNYILTDYTNPALFKLISKAPEERKL